VTLEFGTWSSQHLLAALINEQLLYNRSVHTGAVRDINAEPVQQLQQFFYPAERSWQQQVLFRGRQVMSLALEGMLL
jgi:hypothetical protein